MIAIFSRQNFIAFVQAILVAATVPCASQPPPPPSPEIEKAFQAASCPNPALYAKTDKVSVQVESVPISDLIGKGEHSDSLNYQWGMRVTSADPRISDIVGLILTHAGLVALTGQGNWITFGSGLTKTKTVEIDKAQGLEGRPAALADTGNTYLVSVPDQNVISRFDIEDCQLAAKAIPIYRYGSGSRVTVITRVDYSNVLFSGFQDSTPVAAYGSAYGPHASDPAPLSFETSNLPAIKGYKPIAAVGPERLVPYGLIGIWQSDDGSPGTILQMFDLPQFAHFGSRDTTTPRVLAKLSLPLAAIAAQGGVTEVNIVLASCAAPGEPTYLFGLNWKSLEH